MTCHNRKTDLHRKGAPLVRHFQKGAQLMILLAAFLLASLVAYAATALGSNVINNEKNAVFADKWQYSVNEGEFSEVELPCSESLSGRSHIILKNHLPSETAKGATVLLRTSQQDVSIVVGSETIYNSRDGEHPIAAPTSSYHFVRLPADCAGEAITVMLDSPYGNYAGLMNQIYIGSKASNIFFLLHENGPRFIIGFLVFSLGFLLMIAFLFATGQEGKASITNLGAFFVCAGYWVMVESKMMQFLFPYPVALTNSSIFALTLLPVFSGLYYYNSHTRHYKKIGKFVLMAVSAASLVFAAASIVSPTLPIRILPYYLVLLVLYLLLLVASILGESIKAGKFFSTSVCGILAFGVCALLEMGLYLRNMKEYNQSNLLTLGLLLFCIFMVADSIQNFTRVYRAAIRVDTLSVLAYTDSLTGLQNRTAFLEELSASQQVKNCTVTIAMYDVNSLKVVNDTKGHLVGDALLRHCAKAIKASLRQEDKVYRIGGDEFVAILRHDADFDCDALEARLQLVMEKENQTTLNYTMSIAYGFATFSESTDKTLFDTQARADKRMYACKKAQKIAEQTPTREVEG